jgi:hypothetical protein
VGLAGLLPFSPPPRRSARHPASAPSTSSVYGVFAARYRDRNVLFAYDLLNEPTVPWDTPALREKWNQWIASRFGSADKLAAAWNVDGKTLRWGQ